MKNLIKKIIENQNSGDERSVNESLFFGMGIYMYKDVADEIGYQSVTTGNALFVRVMESDLETVLSGLEELDGYVCIDNEANDENLSDDEYLNL